MKKHEAFPSKYVKTEDLQGREHTVTIERVLEEIIKNDEGETGKPVVYFHESQRGLVLNLINWDSIAELHGDDSDEWIGKKITLYPTKTQFGNKTVPCIRIRANGQAAAQVMSRGQMTRPLSENPDDPDEEIPF